MTAMSLQIDILLLSIAALMEQKYFWFIEMGAGNAGLLFFSAVSSILLDDRLGVHRRIRSSHRPMGGTIAVGRCADQPGAGRAGMGGTDRRL